VVGVAERTAVCVADAVLVGVRVVDGMRVNVAVTSGTSVGGTNLVGVAVAVGIGTGCGAWYCQRRIRLAKPRQYIHSVLKSIKASKNTSAR
jgi:hypothetical protein